MGPEDREIYSKKLANNVYKSYRKNNRLNVELISGQIDIALKCGNRVILVDLPCNPLFDREMGEFYTHYDKMINELVQKKKIGYINMRNAADWSPDDFVDVHHLRVSGQEKFTEALADSLGKTPQLP